MPIIAITTRNMAWKKLPPVEGKLSIGCPNCSSAARVIPMAMEIAVGFGFAYVTRDGEIVYDGEADSVKRGKARTVKSIERTAARNPDHDWRIVKHGPMHGETFQRQGKANWICIESNPGFA